MAATWQSPKVTVYPGDRHTSDIGHWFAMTKIQISSS